MTTARVLAARLTPWFVGVAPLMALGHLVLEASFNFLPVTYVLLIPKLGLSYGQIGTLVLLMSVAGTVSQPFFGWLSDRSDPRLIAIVGLAWGGMMMGLVGFMPGYGALAILLLAAALGSAAFHPPAAAVSALAESDNRGRAMSLFSVGGHLGAALSPALVGLALGSIGLAATAVVIPVALITAGLLAARLRGVTLPQRAAGGQTGSLRHGWALAAIIVLVGARSFYQQALMTYLPEWLRGNGQTLAMAGVALAALMIAVSIGSLFGGTLSDRFGRLPVILVSLGMTAAGHWLLLRTTGAPQMAAVLLIGLMVGASFPVTIVMAQEAWPGRVGLASALVMGLGWLPAGLGAWTVGQIADRRTLTEGLAVLVYAPLVALAAAAAYRGMRDGGWGMKRGA